jgi:hypothetical protein
MRAHRDHSRSSDRAIEQRVQHGVGLAIVTPRAVDDEARDTGTAAHGVFVVRSTEACELPGTHHAEEKKLAPAPDVNVDVRF